MPSLRSYRLETRSRPSFVARLGALAILFALPAVALADPLPEGWGDQAATSVSLNATGGLAIAGHFEGTIEIGGELLSTEEKNGFLARFDDEGKLVWTRRVDALRSFEPYGAVTIDADGRVAALGYSGTTHVFVFDVSGTEQWSLSLGDPSHIDGASIAFDPWGRAVIAGWAYDYADFGGGDIVGDDVRNTGFVVVYDRDGNHVWSRAVGPSRGPDTTSECLLVPKLPQRSR